MKVAYLLDSGSNYQLENVNDCFIVPMVISVKTNGSQHSYFDNVDITRNELESIINGDSQISTSQPIIGQLMSTIEEIYCSYDMIIAIPFAQHLSSTYNCVLNLQREYGDKKFLIADINAMGITGNWFIEDIKKYLFNHKTINQSELNDLASSFRNRVCGAVVVADTKRLVAGGRLKGLKGLVAKTFKLKLIIKFKQSLTFEDKALNIKDAINKTLRIIDKDCQFKAKGIKNCSLLLNLSNQDDNEMIYSYCIEQLNTKTPITKSLLPGCVIAHTGCDTVSILIEANE